MARQTSCLICGKRKAVNIPPYGWLPCKVCQARHCKIARPGITGEVTTEEIKEDRKIYHKEILQPFRDKNLSKEFVEAYPEKVKEMVKEKHVTEEEIKKARNVWGENEYYKRE